MALKDTLKDLPLDRMVLGGLMGMAISSGKLPKGIGSKFLVEFLKPLSMNDKAVDIVAAAMARAEADKSSFDWSRLDGDDRDLWRGRAKTAIRAFSALASHAAAGATNKKTAKKSEG